MKKLRLLALCLLVCGTQVLADVGPAKSISLVRLLASPEQYNGMAISVSGVLHRDEEGRLALYLDVGSAKAEIGQNAFVLLLNPKYEKDPGFKKAEAEGSDNYVMVFGVVDMNPPQPRPFAGLIREVDGIRGYPLIKPLPQSTNPPHS